MLDILTDLLSAPNEWGHCGWADNCPSTLGYFASKLQKFQSYVKESLLSYIIANLYNKQPHQNSSVFIHPLSSQYQQSPNNIHDHRMRGVTMIQPLGFPLFVYFYKLFW
jgi:hypothetical protein